MYMKFNMNENKLEKMIPACLPWPLLICNQEELFLLFHQVFHDPLLWLSPE